MDWKGHFHSGTALMASETCREWLQHIVKEAFLLGFQPPNQVKQLIRAVKKGKPLNEPLPLPWFFDLVVCPYCGQRLRLGFNGRGLVVLNDSCPYPDGLVTEWELNVPSGKILVANDLREWFPISEKHNINVFLGCHLTTLAYAGIGMSHGFVRNTWPSVYWEETRFVIGNYHEELWDGEDMVENPEPCPWEASVADICTDLWWYSICDSDEFERRREHYTPSVAMKDLLEQITVVDVRPGVYRFRQEQGIDRDAGIVKHATFEWVREPDPVRDYLKEEREKSCSAVEALIEACLSWPTVYLGLSSLDPKAEDRANVFKVWQAMGAEERMHAMARAADHYMCVIGSGVEWHEKGFPRNTISEDAKSLAAEFDEVPAFVGQMHWYPISAGYGGLCLGAGVRGEYTRDQAPLHLAPDFVKLALNICQNAIRFGEESHLDNTVYPPAYEIPSCQERMRLFVTCYKGLRERYPDVVFDVGFDQWVAETDLDKYVATFDFGPERPPKKQWGKPPPTVKKGDYFEFDSMLLPDGHFCWHPKHMTGWARKEDAERYCLCVVGDTMSPMGHLHMKETGCGARKVDATVPLKVVGRVIRGTGEGYSSRVLEVAFDYGTPDMRSQRWAIRADDMKAVRQFSDKQEYKTLLTQYKTEFKMTEAKFDSAKKTKK